MTTIATPAMPTTTHPSIAARIEGVAVTGAVVGIAPGVPRMSGGASTEINVTRPAASSGRSAGSRRAGATATLRRRRGDRASDTALTLRDQGREHLVGERAVRDGSLRRRRED